MIPSVPSGAPRVEVREVSASHQPIEGVSPSVTAFLGRTWMGPVDRPVRVRSFEQFRARFGGHHPTSMLPSCVEDYFNNGGREAVIVRLTVGGEVARAIEPSDPPMDSVDAGPPPFVPAMEAVRIDHEPAEYELASGAEPYRQLLGRVAERARPDVDVFAFLPLVAASPGAWANRLTYRFERVLPVPPEVLRNIQQAAALACWDDERVAAVAETLFSLHIEVCIPGEPHYTEFFPYLSASPDAGPLRVDRILDGESKLVRLEAQSMGRIQLPAPGRVGVGQLEGGSDAQLGLTADAYVGSPVERTGIHALDGDDYIGMICIPPDSRNAIGWYQLLFDGGVHKAVTSFCERRRAMLILDAPGFWSDAFRSGDLSEVAADFRRAHGHASNGHTAVFFPWIRKQNPADFGVVASFPPCGVAAGIIARTEARDGVWQAAAGASADLRGIEGLEIRLRDHERAELDPAGVNCFRMLPHQGAVLWGDRVLGGTATGAGVLSSRRLALHLEETLYRGTHWAVFQANDERLWSAMRGSVRAYLQHMQFLGAFVDFKVECGPDTTSAGELARGLINVRIAFTPARAAEYVILYFQQSAVPVRRIQA